VSRLPQRKTKNTGVDTWRILRDLRAWILSDSLKDVRSSHAEHFLGQDGDDAKTRADVKA
jgi:hypothetical protein